MFIVKKKKKQKKKNDVLKQRGLLVVWGCLDLIPWRTVCRRKEILIKFKRLSTSGRECVPTLPPKVLPQSEIFSK